MSKLEIERRFLLKNDDWRAQAAPPQQIEQGYLSVARECTIRARIIGEMAYLTIKGFITHATRSEFEYPIPKEDARAIIDSLCAFQVKKLRHHVRHEGFLFEIDEFFGANAPLILAELELPAENTPFPRPDWLGEEITADSRFTNAYLSKHPYSTWAAAAQRAAPLSGLCQRLGLTAPIFLAPMAGASTPELAAAVANAGGLGALGLGALCAADAQAAIVATRALTERPFQINFFCHTPETPDAERIRSWQNHIAPHFAHLGALPPQGLHAVYASFLEEPALLELALRQRPAAVSFHFGLPAPKQLAALKAAGILTMVSVTQPSEALLAEQAGIDVLIAQGIEAGGHRGMFDPARDPGYSTLALVRLLAGQTSLPIVAAGGIMNGADIRACLHAGAAAAQLGTAFLPCPESGASALWRNKLLDAPATQITDSISGRPARALLNHWHTRIDVPNRPPHAGYPYSYDLGKQLHTAALRHGEHGFAAYWAGAGAARARRMDAAQLMRTLCDELAQA